MLSDPGDDPEPSPEPEYPTGEEPEFEPEPEDPTEDDPEPAPEPEETLPEPRAGEEPASDSGDVSYPPLSPGPAPALEPGAAPEPGEDPELDPEPDPDPYPGEDSEPGAPLLGPSMGAVSSAPLAPVPVVQTS